MAFGFFKDGDEVFESALEEINRKEYDKAMKTLDRALEKKCSKAALAEVYKSFIIIGKDLDNASAYRNLSGKLNALSESEFRFGITTFDTSELKAECDAMAMCIDANKSSGSGRPDNMIKAAGNLMSVVGDKKLRINEYYTGNSLTGIRLATGMMAEANEDLAESVYMTDPQKAAEYQQQAYNFRRQNGESGDKNLKLMQQYSKACTCWICGRQAVGEGMHFFEVKADPSPGAISNDEKELQHSMSDRGYLYICRACFTAINGRADDIASEYHRKSMEELRRAESELTAAIAATNSRISALQSQVSMMKMSR